MARKKLETLTEQMFYVLLALREERHGYGIMQAIAELTGGRVSVGAGPCTLCWSGLRKTDSSAAPVRRTTGNITF